MIIDLTPSQLLVVEMALTDFRNELFLQRMCVHSDDAAAELNSQNNDVCQVLSKISEGK